MTDQDGAAARASSPLPMPAPVVFDGQRLPASYANFYIANARRARADLQRPGRPRGARTSWPSSSPTAQVVGIHAVDLVWGLGTLHCMTQQEPAAQSLSSGLD